MAKKKDNIEKAPEKKATATPVKRTAKVSKSSTMEVVVTANKFGTYKKGDTIKMHRSTALACIKSKVVKEKE
jgi:hypothetical protein